MPRQRIPSVARLETLWRNVSIMKQSLQTAALNSAAGSLKKPLHFASFRALLAETTCDFLHAALAHLPLEKLRQLLLVLEPAQGREFLGFIRGGGVGGGLTNSHVVGADIVALLQHSLSLYGQDSANTISSFNHGRHSAAEAAARTVDLDLAYRLFIRLGDIQRYRQQTYNTVIHKSQFPLLLLARTFYLLALDLDPANGNAYNQLAVTTNLLGNDAATTQFYIYSVCVAKPFLTALGNLDLALKKITKKLHQSIVVNSKSNKPTATSRTKNAQPPQPQPPPPPAAAAVTAQIPHSSSSLSLVDLACYRLGLIFLYPLNPLQIPPPSKSSLRNNKSTSSFSTMPTSTTPSLLLPELSYTQLFDASADEGRKDTSRVSSSQQPAPLLSLQQQQQQQQLQNKPENNDVDGGSSSSADYPIIYHQLRDALTMVTGLLYIAHTHQPSFSPAIVAASASSSASTTTNQKTAATTASSSKEQQAHDNLHHQLKLAEYRITSLVTEWRIIMMAAFEYCSSSLEISSHNNNTTTITSNKASFSSQLTLFYYSLRLLTRTIHSLTSNSYRGHGKDGNGTSDPRVEEGTTRNPQVDYAAILQTTILSHPEFWQGLVKTCQFLFTHYPIIATTGSNCSGGGRILDSNPFQFIQSHLSTLQTSASTAAGEESGSVYIPQSAGGEGVRHELTSTTTTTRIGIHGIDDFPLLSAFIPFASTTTTTAAAATMPTSTISDQQDVTGLSAMQIVYPGLDTTDSDGDGSDLLVAVALVAELCVGLTFKYPDAIQLSQINHGKWKFTKTVTASTTTPTSVINNTVVANTTKINHNRDSVAEAVAAAGLSSLEPPSSQILVNDDMFLTAPLAPSSSTSFSSAAVVLGSDTTVKSKSDNMMVMDDEEEGEDDEDDEDFGEIVVFRGISSSSSSFSSNSSPHPAAPLQLLQQHQQVDTMRFLGLGDDDNNIHAFDNEEGIANTPIHLLTTRPSLIPGSASLVSAASPAPASSALHPHLSLQHLFYNEDGSDDFGLSAGIGGGGGMGNLWYNVGGINAASPQQSSVQPLPGSHLPPSSTMPSLLHSMLYNPNHNSAVPPPQPPPGF